MKNGVTQYCSVEQHAKSKSITVTVNKTQQTFSGKPFGDLKGFPLTVVDSESKTKVEVDYDVES